MKFQKPFAFISLAAFGLALTLFLPLAATAQVTPLIFERAQIRIDSPPAREKDKTPKPTHAPLSYDTEVRPEDAMKLEYIHTLNTLTEANGVMIAFAAPSMVALPMMKVYSPVDALFINDAGMVVQILPNVTLGQMAQEVAAHEPVKAFLFLKAGQVVARGIRPQDVVTGSMFTPTPPVME
jgi:uncharacterized membrane protein (UPF0127 family)